MSPSRAEMEGDAQEGTAWDKLEWPLKKKLLSHSSASISSVTDRGQEERGSTCQEELPQGWNCCDRGEAALSRELTASLYCMWFIMVPVHITHWKGVRSPRRLTGEDAGLTLYSLPWAYRVITSNAKSCKNNRKCSFSFSRQIYVNA